MQSNFLFAVLLLDFVANVWLHFYWETLKDYDTILHLYYYC